MRLAERIGLNVPKSEMRIIRGVPFFLVERYDRIVSGGTVTRYIQEDFCQATKTPPECKYQNQGGPGIVDCYEVLINNSVNVVADVNQFLMLLAFNIVIGNHDAHAKNISLLHPPQGIRLAPFYDILSTQVYPDLDHEFAMSINR